MSDRTEEGMMTIYILGWHHAQQSLKIYARYLCLLTLVEEGTASPNYPS
jgi:hypothetical protein